MYRKEHLHTDLWCIQEDYNSTTKFNRDQKVLAVICTIRLFERSFAGTHNLYSESGHSTEDCMIQ